MFLTAILDFAGKTIFACLDFSRFVTCCVGDLPDNESEEKPSVAICGGSICILTGLFSRKVSETYSSSLPILKLVIKSQERR